MRTRTEFLVKEKIAFLGGFISFIAVVVFAVDLTMQDIPQNVVSWMMWATLDTFVLFSSIAAGNRRPWLPLGYSLGASLTAMILLNKGVWHWGFVESVSVCGVMIATACWAKLGPKSAVIAATCAMNIAGIPTLHDAWVLPTPSSWWLWGTCAVTGLMSVYGAKAWTIQDRLFACSSFLFNAIMTVLVLR